MVCPQCGADDWHEVIEHVQQAYRACGNCKWAPSFSIVENHNATEWLLALQNEHSELSLEVIRLTDEMSLAAIKGTKPSTLVVGNLNKATRLRDLAWKKIFIAERVSRIVESLEQGQITLHVPELGLLLSFEWGGFELFKSIGALPGEEVVGKLKEKK